MEHHPLIIQLQKTAQLHGIDEARAHLTFQSYLELSHGRKFQNLKYCFNEKLKTFYFLGLKDKNGQDPEVILPVMLNDELSPEDIDSLFSTLCPLQNRLHIIICDRDSASTCYKITKGLVKPDSLVESKMKKDKDLLSFQLEQIVQKNKKKLYMKALNKS